MAQLNFVGRRELRILACALAGLAAPWALAHADSPIEEHRPANSHGSVEIINVAGAIDLQGWDKPEVAVTGTVGKNVERVDVTSGADRTSIHVEVRSQHFLGFGSDGEAHLLVHVPLDSTVSASLVSSDIKVSAVRGDLKLQTVSGNISGEAGGDVHASSVSGNVTFTAAAAKAVELKSVSGDVVLVGGNAYTEITTVSGNAKITLGTPPRARLQSVSGSLTANFALGPDAQIDGETVSGDVRLDFANNPLADFDIQTLSGAIKNCFGPKPEEPRHGPGSRLTFKSGDNSARVRISTK